MSISPSLSRLPTPYFWIVLIALCSAACGDNFAPAPSTIGEHLRADKRFTSLTGLLEQAELMAPLDAPGTQTLFAPTDNAFAALLVDPAVASRKWRELPKLGELLRYHLHDGTIAEAELERVTALTTLEGPEIHVRLTLDGLELNDVVFSGEVIEADNGIIYVLDKVLVRPLITTTERFESAPNISLATEGGFAFASDYQIIEGSGYIHDLRIFLEIEHPDVSKLYISLAHGPSGKRISLLAAPQSNLNDLKLTLADSADHDLIDDVATGPDSDSQAYPLATYRPAVPLEAWLGETLDGDWTITIFDARQDASEEGRLIRWGFIATTGPELPEQAVVINKRALTAKVFGRGFTESIDVMARGVSGLSGEMELSGKVGEINAELRVLPAEQSFASLLFPIPRDAALDSPDSRVVARIGDVSRVAHFAAKVVEPDAKGIELLAHLPLPSLGAEGYRGSDLWGWTDPDSGAEIALVTTAIGTTFVDISTPTAPVVLGMLTTATEASDWRDVKVFKDHAFIVSEAEGHGMQIFDLRLLREQSGPQSFAATAHVNLFGSAHNLFINEDTGFAYVVGSDYFDCFGGLLMFDIAEPLAPVFRGCFSGGVPAGQPNGPDYPQAVYIHDVQCVIYAGPDLEHVGSEICLSSDEDTLGIVDVNNKAAPAQLSRVTYEGAGYTHQGWLTEDHQYFILNDEFDEAEQAINTRSYLFDVRDLDAPVLIGTFDNPRDAIGHNTYIKGDTAFMANYTSGLRIVDIADIANATCAETAYYDTYPDDDQNDGRPGSSARCSSAGCGVAAYQGVWSNYPFFESGVVVVSDINRGLFVLRVN